MNDQANQRRRLIPSVESCIEDNRLRLRVENATSHPRRNELVSNGIPIPRDFGTADVTQLRLTDGEGRPVSAQFRALAWWPEGNIKWVLVSFIATAEPMTAKDYYLEFHPGEAYPQPPGRHIGTESQLGQVEVDTGSLRFVVSKTGKRLIDQLHLKTSRGWVELNPHDHSLQCGHP